MASVDDLHSIPLFQNLTEDELALVAPQISSRSLPNGETLFRHGDPGDSMYIVRFGEVNVMIPDAEGRERVRARLGRNEVFGEMALLTGDSRSATIIANLDTDLYVLSREGFHELFRRHPTVVTNLLDTLIHRLRRTSTGEREREKIRTLCCHSALGDSDTRYLSTRLAALLGGESGKKVALLNVSLLSADGGAGGGREGERPDSWDKLLRNLNQINEREILSFLSPTEFGVDVLPNPSAGQIEAFSPDSVPRLLSLLREAYEFTVIGTSAESSSKAFCQKAMDQSEQLLFALPSDDQAEALRQWNDLQGAAPSLAAKTRIVLRRGKGKIKGLFDRVKSGFGAGFVYQVPVDPEAERQFAEDGIPRIESGRDETGRALRRIARRTAGIAVGLALGGGGARGLAHIGVLEVFEKEDIPIDLVGGTSIGSIVAAMHANGHTPDEMRILCQTHIIERKPLNDYTIPRTAILRGWKAERIMRDIYGDVLIEELPIPYFSVGADLITGREVIIDRGPLWQSVRASMSLPGVLPPFRYRDEFALVDGGVANNVPGDVLKQRGAEFCIAVNIAPERGSYFNFNLPRSHGWFGRLLRRNSAIRNFLDAPTIMRVIMRSINVSSIEITNMRSRNFDVHLLPAVGEFDLFDFDKLDTLVERGREAAQDRLAEIRDLLETLKD
ncbi:MAG: patatin-like phospholipase family protein [Nitrospinota bacterium]|nr:patatin-like phospholipase family protein [Nitrospinota bacterium]MDP6618286.1 patatin-like phospholipase family protein [Nitrospinota bacterium]